MNSINKIDTKTRKIDYILKSKIINSNNKKISKMSNKSTFLKMTLAFLIIALLFPSCATLITGTKDRITFNSDPSGATIYFDGVEQCKTPCSLKVKRSINDTDVEFKLEGYETRLITLSKEFNVVSILNLGNLLGWGIDAVSGAVMKYDRKVYDITLSGNKKTSMINPTRINIDTKSNIVELYVVEH